MSASSHFKAVCLIVLLVTGCADDPGCSTDYYTPAFVQKLAGIKAPETLLMASVIARWDFVQDKDPDETLPSADDFRREALQLAPNDEMVLAAIRSTCYGSVPEKDSAGCGLDWAIKLKDLNPENGYYWANLAHDQLNLGDVDAALKSYQRAAAAETFAIGWGKQVYRLSMALQDALDTTESCSTQLAAGAASANLPVFQKFTETCRSQSGDEQWRQACLDLGRKMEEQSLTLITRMIGFPLQRIVYEAKGDEEGVAAVEARQEQLQKHVGKQSEQFECRWDDPEWIHQWLVNIRDYDEMETLRRMSETSAGC